MKKLKSVLSMIKQRCNNPNNKDYSRYGAKGITICEEWNNPDNFIKWALENGFVSKDIDPINFLSTSIIGDIVCDYIQGKPTEIVNKGNIELRKSTII